MKIAKPIFCLLILFSISCKGSVTLKSASGVDGVIAQPGATSVSGKITAENGGVIQLENMRLTIPAGALDEDTEITAEWTDVAAPAFDGATKVGRGVKFSPEGLQFLKPIEAEFCHSANEFSAKNLNEKSALIYYAEDNGELVGMSGHVDLSTHCITGQLEHFSVYIPAAQLLSAGNTQPNVTGANFLPGATTIMAGLPVRVRTTITDFNGGGTPGTIISAFLLYCRIGDLTCSMTPATATNKVPLQPDNSDPAVANRYFATIPEAFVTLAGFRTRFVVTDQLGVTRTTGIANRSISRTGTGLRFNPGTAFNISAGFARNLTLQAFDGTAWRNISADNFSVSGGIGTVAKSGPSAVQFSALTTGAGTVNASAGSLTTSVSVNVLTGMLTHIELMDNNQVIITNPINVGAGSSYTFDALGYDAYGNTVVINPQFTVQGGVGSVNAAAVFTAAGAAPLTGTVTATIGGVTDVVNVNVWTQPTVVSTTPGNGAMGVSISTPIVITFSEPMLVSTLATSSTTTCTGTVDISSDNFVTCVAMTSATPAFSGGNSIATLQPAVPLAGMTTYQIRVLNSVASANGAFLAAVSAAFTTISLNPPGTEDLVNWNKKIGSAVSYSNEEATAITVDAAGNVYVVGYGYNLVDPQSNMDWWIRKFDVSGTEDTTNWDKKISSPPCVDPNTCYNSQDQALAVAIDPAGNVYVVGTGADLVTPISGRNWWVKKFSAAGIEDTINWDKKIPGNDTGFPGFPGTSHASANAIAIDAAGYVYIVGHGSNLMDAYSSTDVWIKKFDSAGNEDVVNWDKKFGQSGTYDEATGVAVDAFGNVYVSGTGYNLAGAQSGYDWWLKKFNSAGVEDVLNWDKKINGGILSNGSGSEDVPTGLAVDAGNNIYVIGSSRGFSGSTGDRDWWLKKFDGAGVEDTINWNKVIASSVAGVNTGGDDTPRSISIDATGNIYVAGDGWNLVGTQSGQDWWIKKFASNGVEDTIGWDKKIDGTPGNYNPDAAATIAVNSSGIYVAGFGTKLISATSYRDIWLKRFWP